MAASLGSRPSLKCCDRYCTSCLDNSPMLCNIFSMTNTWLSWSLSSSHCGSIRHWTPVEEEETRVKCFSIVCCNEQQPRPRLSSSKFEHASYIQDQRKFSVDDPPKDLSGQAGAGRQESEAIQNSSHAFEGSEIRQHVGKCHRKRAEEAQYDLT